jgi:hypothetical protein
MKAEIKAHDLMLGNLLKYVNGENIFKVIGIHEFGIDSEDEIETTYMEYENFEPIPLTEEWLVRFGFENCINGWWSENELFNVKFIDNDIEIYLSGSDNDLAYKKIKYVHQIQNLYYIIIGEHLTIK